ncbi:MAG: ATP-binding protein [Candidatus Omnitrophota bacterium]|jgi:heavy metal sensor kinase
MKIPFRSVKFRLTIWYALILAVLLSIFALFMYSELSRALYRDADQKLKQEVLALSDSVQSYLDGIDLGARLAEESRSHKNPFTISPEIRLKLSEVIALWEKSTHRFSQSTVSMRFINLDESPLVSNLQGWESEILFPHYERDSLFMEVGESYQTIHFRKQPIRLYYDLVRYKSRPLFIIQAMLPIQEVARTLNRLALIIWVSIPVAVAAACFAGWFMAKRSFQPVDLMIREARQITAAYLKTRLPRTQAGDELDRLAETLNEMMDRIEASTRAVRDFSSDVSHELKTPLAIIKGEVELALRRSRSPEALVETLRVIGGEVEELILLVEDLMLLVKSDARQIRYEMGDVFLGEILAQTVQRFHERAQQKNITLTLKAGQEVVIRADPGYLKRLFSNLLDNALKFTPEFGRVTVELKPSDHRSAAVEVVDNGMGIDPAVLDKVFSRFYRADQARSHEGVGLGLNIAKAIADAHDAHIEITSKQGQGTTVRVIFALSEAIIPA